MVLRTGSIAFGLVTVMLVGHFSTAWARGGPNGPSRAPSGTPPSEIYGPGEVYARVPARDEYGRDQLAMFRAWSPDPVGHHEASLKTLDSGLAAVIRKAQSDNPNLRFVIGSG